MTKIADQESSNDGPHTQSRPARTNKADTPQGSQRGLRFDNVPHITEWLSTKGGHYDNRPDKHAEWDYCAEVFGVPEAPSLQTMLSRFRNDQG